MKKFLKWTAIVVISLIVLLFGVFKYMQFQTKKASPEATVEYKKDGKELSVFYCRPSKKDREIFGGLVPFGKVWRTGANEATTFSTNKDLQIDGKTLAAGKYTLWTIPDKNEWTIIWNKKQYGWGVDFNSVPTREADQDALQVKVPVETVSSPTELFTIAFEEGDSLNLVLAWDKTKVSVPLK
jgi:hypothetical protein